MAIQVVTQNQSDLRPAATVTKRNFNTALAAGPFSGDVVGHWRAFFVRLPAGHAASNQRHAIAGHDAAGTGVFTGGGDWVMRLAGGTFSTTAIRQRPQVREASSAASAWSGSEGDISSVPQLAVDTNAILLAGICNIGTNASPVWRNWAALCPVGGAAASQVGATATTAAYLVGTSQVLLGQLLGRISSVAPLAGTRLEDYAHANGDFPWDTANNRPHHAAIEALAASGANPFLTYEGLIAAQNAATLPYANCRQGKGELLYRYTLRNLGAGLANSGTAANGNLAEQGTAGGLTDAASIVPAHWLGGAPAITETFDKFIPGRGARAFTVAGTYAGGTTALERRWVLRGTSTPAPGRDWADITGIGGGNWSFTETVPVGNFDLIVRDKNTPALSTSSLDWLSGARVVMHGQSGMALSIRSTGGPNGENTTATAAASGVLGQVVRLDNVLAINAGTYVKPGPALTRINGGTTPVVGQGAVAVMNAWNAINPGVPLQIVNMAINTYGMDDWTSNIAIPAGHSSWRFLGPLTLAAPGATDGNASGTVNYHAFLCGGYTDLHMIMWTPGMSSTVGAAGNLIGSGTGRAGYVAAVDARFVNSPAAPWLVLPVWRVSDGFSGSDAGSNVRNRHMLFADELGATRGIVGPCWADTVADGDNSGHAANLGVGGGFGVSDASAVGQGKIGAGMGRAIAWAFDRRVKAHGPRVIGAWWRDDLVRTIIEVELARTARTLNAAAIRADQFFISTDGGATFANTGFTVALSPDGTRAALTSTGSAWPTGTRVDAFWSHIWNRPAQPESGAEAGLHGLLHDGQAYRGHTNLATPAGNVLQGVNRQGVGVAGVAVATRGPARLLATERFAGSRTVTVRLMAADGVTVLREKTLSITAS
jgi:hypothetical protein